MVAPAGTPPAVVERLNREFTAALRSPEMRERLARMGADLVGFQRVFADGDKLDVYVMSNGAAKSGGSRATWKQGEGERAAASGLKTDTPL